jgi:phosphatidylglycerol lysyltransferase
VTRRLLLWLVFGAATWLLASHVPDLIALASTMRTGLPAWIAAATALQVAYYACYVATFRQSFVAVGVVRPYREYVPAVLGSLFANVVVPAAGTAGPALVVDDSSQHGASVARSTAGVVVSELADFSGFAIIVFGGLIYLAILRRLTSYELVAAGLLLVLVLAFVAVLLLGVLHPAALLRTLTALQSLVTRLRRVVRRAQAETDSDWASRQAAEFSEAAGLVAAHPRELARAWAFSLLGHTADLVSLGCLALAFGWRSPGSIIAAYAVGVLLWVISIVPQGIGVVEGAMTLVFVSFGAPAATAAAITLAFRGLSFWLPFAIGGVLLRRVESFRTHRDEASGKLAVFVGGLLVAAAGAVNILAGLRPSSRFAEHLPAHLPLVVSAGHLSAVIVGVALLFTARGMWRRSRMAWLVTVVTLLVSSAVHVIHGHLYQLSIVNTALALWLVTERQEFHARSDAPSVAQGIRVLLGAFGITLGYGTLGFYLLDRHFSVNFGLIDAIRQTVVMFTQFTNPGLQPITGFGRYFAVSIYAVAAVSFAYALLMLLRPVLVRRHPSAEERARAEAIVAEWGRSSLARVTLLPDKIFWFSPGGSVVSYVVRNNVAAALGDPIGPPEDLRATVEEFSARCRRNGWLPAFYQTLPDSVEAYQETGFELVRIGHEAVVHLADFTLAGKSHKSMRNRMHSLEEAGYSAEVLQAPQPPWIMRELRSVSDAWLSEKGGVESRYSLGWFDQTYIENCDVMAVRGASGAIEAFANLIPEYRLNEATIDLMRHLPNAPSGMMDYLFVKLIEWAREAGYDTFNLGLSTFAGVGDQPRDPAVEKAMRFAYLHLNAFYSFTGLHEYKEKFDPEWQPRYLAYPDAASLPRVLWALISANTGESTILLQLTSSLRASRASRQAE